MVEISDSNIFVLLAEPHNKYLLYFGEKISWLIAGGRHKRIIIGLMQACV